MHSENDPKVELKGFPLDIEYFVEEYEYCYRITVAFHTKCRDTGSPMKLYQYYSYGRPQYTKLEAIRTALIDSLTHEVDECLYADGDRIFDPHIPEKLHG